MNGFGHEKFKMEGMCAHGNRLGKEDDLCSNSSELTDSEQSEQSSDTDQRIEQRNALIERLIIFGKVTSRLEESLMQEEKMNEQDLETILKDHSIPEKLASRCRTAVEKYYKKRAEAEAFDSTFSLELKKRGVSDTPEARGRWLVSGKTYLEPVGRITLERKEAYFILTFEDPMDYLSFHEQWGEGEGQRSAGRFHRGFGLSELTGFEKNGDISVLAIDGSQTLGENTLVHERQHFINQEIADVFGTESNQQYAAIKDELLAYLRDGSSGTDMFAALTTILYDHLWNSFSDDERKKTQVLLKKICTVIDEIVPFFFPNEKQRAQCVGMLLATPLHRWQKRLPLIRDALKKEMMNSPTIIL